MLLLKRTYLFQSLFVVQLSKFQYEIEKCDNSKNLSIVFNHCRIDLIERYQTKSYKIIFIDKNGKMEIL
jgi:hypothetical protein